MRRTVVVTGASSGIGLATARCLNVAGFDVVGLVENEGAAADLASRAGRDIRQLVVDLADPEARAGVIEELAPWGLVNNAGYMNAGQIRDVELDTARRQFEVMVVAPMDLARQVLPGMVDRGQGRIVNVTSSAVHTSTPLTSWYAACKAALRELNDGLRVELLGTGVYVVDVEPGGYRTNIWRGAAAELTRRRRGSREPEMYDRVLDHLDGAEALMGDPDDVGRAITEAMTTGDPRHHIRVGPGARWLRTVDDVVPDGLWDRLVSVVSRKAG